MKKIFIIFAFLLSAFNVFADGLSANDVTLKNDDTANLDINLDNASSDIVGLQFNINLSEGITPMMDGDKVVITPSNRLNGSYSLRGKKMAAGSYLFTFLSNERTPIEGNSGTLFSITLQNSASLADGTYRAVISDVTITDLNGYEQMAANAESRITVVHSYKLTYYVDGAKYKEISYDFGDAITPEQVPTKEGYTFSGWSEIPATMPARDVEVTGSFAINKYKVTFISDGTVIKEEMLEFGSEITAPANPTKVGHTFTEWNPAVDATVPAHDVTYTAQFSANQYTITFDTDGGSAVAPITQNYSTAITKPANPVKQGYTFAGWNPAIPETMPAENMTIKALWTVNSYKLTYKVDGAVYKELSYDYGDAITPEADPTKEGYTFSGWSEIPATMPAHDVEVNGSFTMNMYTIKFVNEDGSVLQSSEVEYGATPVYSGATPTKSATAEYSYTFAGWTPEIVTVTADATYTATYTSTSNQYTLTYKVDGAVYKEYTLSYGDAITPEAEPTKEGYTFSGWSEIPTTMPAHDVEVTGSFTKGAYKLTYFVDGAKYKELSYDYGDAITPEAEPTKEGYTFSGWSEIPATMPAHDVEVNGSFTINMYTIKFVNEDGTVLQSSEAEYGATPVYSGATPTKASTAEYSYTFAGWTPEIVTVTADATYTATYTSTSNQYTLTYKVDGDVYKEYTLNYGDAITPEAEPTKERHTFSGWSEIPATMPAHDVEVTGTFEINVADVLAPVVEEGTDITEENAEDITEFKLTLNEVETIEVNEDASAELLIDGVLSGTASKDDISVSDGVITIKFNYIDNEENAPDKTKAFRKSVARAAEDEVSVEVIIAAGSFNINGENVTENISYSYTAPASVAEEIEENLSSVIHGIAAAEHATKVYNLKGIRVSKNQKGIVIKNGKTFFVK